MKVFVAGSTGQTGSRIVNELVNREIPVTALVRSEEKAKQILPANVELVVGDVMKLQSFASSLDDCDILICATGATPSLDLTAFYQVDYVGTGNLIKLAQEKPQMMAHH